MSEFFTHDTGGMEKAKDYLLLKTFDHIPEQLKLCSLVEVLHAFDTTARKLHTDGTYKTTPWVRKMLGSGGGLSRTLAYDWNSHSAKGIGSFEPDRTIESETLDFTAQHYKDLIGDMTQVFSALEAPAKPTDYLSIARAGSRRVKGAEKGMRAVLGDEFFLENFTPTDPKLLHENSIKAAEVGGFCKVPHQKKYFEQYLSTRSFLKMESTTAIRIGIAIGLAIKAEREGISIETLMEQEKEAGRLPPPLQKKQKEGGTWIETTSSSSGNREVT